MATETKRRRTTCADHTVCPEGYLAWHAWAEKKAKRHYQVRCDECGRFLIWRRKPAVPGSPTVPEGRSDRSWDGLSDAEAAAEDATWG